MLTVSRHVKSGYVTTIDEKKQYEGLWWVSGHSDKAVSGYLHVTPNGMWLYLNGTLKTTENFSHSDINLGDHSLINGIQKNGCHFTLETCTESTKLSPISFGYSTQTFSVGRVYCGIHANSLDELKFSEYCVKYTYLSDWFHGAWLASPKKVEGGFFVGCEPSTATIISPLRFEIQNKEAVIEITSDPRWDNNFQECRIRIETIMTILCESPMSLKEVSIKVLNPFQDFLNLATGHPNSITSLSAKFKDESINIHSQSEYKGQARSSHFNQGAMLFFARNISENPASYINKYFAIEQEMKDVCELFFGVHYDQGAFTTNRLLNVVQALEAYSRVRYGEYKVPKDEHKYRSEAIVESAPEEYKDWLRQSLSYANNKSLKERLLELIEKAQPLSMELFSDPVEFSKWVVDTRNYLTHRDRGGKKRIASEDTLDLMIYSLLWLFRIHFLLEVGFKHNQCNELLKQNNNFNSLCTDPELKTPWRTGDMPNI